MRDFQGPCHPRGVSPQDLTPRSLRCSERLFELLRRVLERIRNFSITVQGWPDLRRSANLIHASQRT